ncbi:MAG: hypothetical protein COA70_04745 [Planctomycetota bacterium]|nr:MAG: hypothetical protein COA70_04745 [Planctomycetota bacterium]
MRQTTFAEEGFERYRKPTHREKFLDEMDQIVPWKRLFKAVKPCYPKGQGGRPPIGIERMLRIYFLQHWFNLSDPGAKEALYAEDLTAERCYRNRPLTDEARARNTKKSQIRARVEHPFLILKRVFGFTKVRYRGLAKNEHRMMVAFELVNL